MNTYARPSPHGNIRASRAAASHAARIGMLAPWAADGPVERAARPPHTIRHAHDHPQHAAAHRAALPAKPALHRTINRCTAQYIIQHTPARAQQCRRTRAYPTRTRAQHARVARQRSATHRAHFPPSAAGLPQTHNAHNAHTATMRTGARARAHTQTHTLPLPAHALGVAVSNQASRS